MKRLPLVVLYMLLGLFLGCENSEKEKAWFNSLTPGAKWDTRDAPTGREAPIVVERTADWTKYLVRGDSQYDSFKYSLYYVTVRHDTILSVWIKP